MLILLLFLLSMFIQIDAGDGQEQPRRLSESPQDAALMDRAEEEQAAQEEQIAIDQIRQSLDRMLSRLDDYYENIRLDRIPEDLYDPTTRRILDEYYETRNEGWGDGFARTVLQSYFRDRPKFAKRGVQFPQLYELDEPVTINVPLFQSVGMANDQPLTDLDKAIRDAFIDQILEYKDRQRAASVPPVESVLRPFPASRVSSRAMTSSPFAVPSASRQLSSAAESTYVLNRAQSLSQSPRDLNLARGLENRSAARGVSVEPFALPGAIGTPEVLPKIGVKKQREESPREEENDQQSKKRKLDSDASGEPNFNLLNPYNPDPDNDGGGGIPVL